MTTDLTTRDAAEQMRTSPETVRSLIASGDLRAYRLRGVAGPWRIPADAIREYRERQANRDPWARTRPRRVS